MKISSLAFGLPLFHSLKRFPQPPHSPYQCHLISGSHASLRPVTRDMMDPAWSIWVIFEAVRLFSIVVLIAFSYSFLISSGLALSSCASACFHLNFVSWICFVLFELLVGLFVTLISRAFFNMAKPGLLSCKRVYWLVSEGIVPAWLSCFVFSHGFRWIFFVLMCPFQVFSDLDICFPALVLKFPCFTATQGMLVNMHFLLCFRNWPALLFPFSSCLHIGNIAFVVMVVWCFQFDYFCLESFTAFNKCDVMCTRTSLLEARVLIPHRYCPPFFPGHLTRWAVCYNFPICLRCSRRWLSMPSLC